MIKTNAPKPAEDGPPNVPPAARGEGPTREEVDKRWAEQRAKRRAHDRAKSVEIVTYIVFAGIVARRDFPGVSERPAVIEACREQARALVDACTVDEDADE